MSYLDFSVEERDRFSIVSFSLKGDVLEPKALEHLEPPSVNLTKGVVISGRGPIWLYSFLTHCYHPAKWTGTHDPRLGGAVVNSAHTTEVTVGEVIPL